jgi:hypothetical protein
MTISTAKILNQTNVSDIYLYNTSGPTNRPDKAHSQSIVQFNTQSQCNDCACGLDY